MVFLYTLQKVAIPLFKPLSHPYATVYLYIDDVVSKIDVSWFEEALLLEYIYIYE